MSTDQVVKVTGFKRKTRVPIGRNGVEGNCIFEHSDVDIYLYNKKRFTNVMNSLLGKLIEIVKNNNYKDTTYVSSKYKVYTTFKIKDFALVTYSDICILYTLLSCYPSPYIYLGVLPHDILFTNSHYKMPNDGVDINVVKNKNTNKRLIITLKRKDYIDIKIVIKTQEEKLYSVFTECPDHIDGCEVLHYKKVTKTEYEQYLKEHPYDSSVLERINL